MGLASEVEQLRRREIGLLMARSAVLVVMIGLAFFIIGTKVEGLWVPIVFGIMFTALVVLNILSTLNSTRSDRARASTLAPLREGAFWARRRLIAYCVTLAVVGGLLGIIASQIPPIGVFGYAMAGLLVAVSVALYVVGSARIARRFTPPPSD
jgi:hypothetical protein